MEKENPDRREFLKKTLMAGAGLTIAGISESHAADKGVKQNLS